MSKQLVVNGRTILVEDQDVDEVCAMFKENIIIDNEEGWRSKKEMEKYCASTFIDKARYYLSLAPPDLTQCSEKIWLAAVFAVKEAFLSSGDLKSHKSLSFFCRFALDCSGVIRSQFWRLTDAWIKAEKMHGDTYGRGNFSPSEYSSVISDVQTFVNEFSKIDRKKLLSEFSKSFLAGTDPEVYIKKEKHIVKLGGVSYKCDYSVYV